MKQAEARTRILEHWDRWILSQKIDRRGPTGKDSLKFFYELQDTGSPLLDFPSRQDKWRTLYAWLLSEGRLYEHWISSAPPIVPTRKPRTAGKRSGAKT